jgi:hypothetical protein
MGTSLPGAADSTVGGSAGGDGWPSGAEEMFGGAGSVFVVAFVTSSSAVRFDVAGSIGIDLVANPELDPQETSVNVRLSPGAGTTLCSETLDGSAACFERFPADLRARCLA